MFVTVCHYLYVATGIRFAKAISKQPKAQNQNRLSSDYIVIANSNDADIASTGIDGDDEELCIEPSNDNNHRSAKRAPARRVSAIPLLSNFDETEI